MTTSHRFRSSLGNSKRILNLAWPMVVGQLAVVGNGVIDTAMVSRFSAPDLAALSVGVSIYVSIFVALNGVLQALTPTIGQLFGADNYRQIGLVVKQGFWLSVLLIIIGWIFLFNPEPFLKLANANVEMSTKTREYLRILCFALPATLAFRIYGALNNAIGRPKMVMSIQIGALLLKIPLNTLFIFGGLGIAPMGASGCGAATAVSAWLMMIAGFVIVKNVPYYAQFGIFNTQWVWPQWTSIKSLLKLGIPMGLSYLIEVTSFTFMAIFIARIGITDVAGHQLAANFGTILYMLPLSIASSTCTLVAQAIGARELIKAQELGKAGILTALVIAIPMSFLIWFGRQFILNTYTNDHAIITAAIPIYSFLAVYQIFDSLQVNIAFVLRAYKVAVVPTLLYGVSLWGLGIGGGYILGFNPQQFIPWGAMGANGFWMANTASLMLVSLALWIYLQRIYKRFSLH